MISLNLLIPATEAASQAITKAAFGWADFFFYFFALIAIVAAFEVITQESPINSAIFVALPLIKSFQPGSNRTKGSAIVSQDAPHLIIHRPQLLASANKLCHNGEPEILD